MNSQGVVSCQGPSKTFELWEPLEATASGTGLARAWPSSGVDPLDECQICSGGQLLSASASVSGVCRWSDSSLISSQQP